MDLTKRRSRILTVVLICLVACALLLCVLHPSAEHLYVLEVQGDSLYAGSDPDGLPSYSISRADLYLRNRFLLPVKVSSLRPGDSITVISNGRVLATGPYQYSVIYCIFAD